MGKTARTLEYLVEKHPDRAFTLVVGADIVADTPRWYRFDRVRELARVIVVGRAGEVAFADGPALPDVSSTEVRERLLRGEDVSALVPTRVLAYLKERELYGE